jgi:hypothetical protein
MSDRELLELAANAIGMRIKLTKSKIQEGKLFCLRINGGETKPWNPLDHDGDALRLAVQLTLEIDVCLTGIAVRTPIGHKVLIDSKQEPDAYAATRRAITRAAAAIGKTMENQNV